jgi:subtilase family serine protease
VSASRGADVVSFSGGTTEDCMTSAQLAEAHSLINELAARRITVTAASGDIGVADLSCTANSVVRVAKRGVGYPASDPLVLAVGGTTLVANAKTGAYIGETAWDQPGNASGGGFSSAFARPSYQDGVRGTGAHRGLPDVAADAGRSGLALIAGYEMEAFEGTSAGTPFWAGLAALADQYAGRTLALSTLPFTASPGAPITMPLFTTS